MVRKSNGATVSVAASAAVLVVLSGCAPYDDGSSADATGSDAEIGDFSSAGSGRFTFGDVDGHTFDETGDYTYGGSNAGASPGSGASPSGGSHFRGGELVVAGSGAYLIPASIADYLWIESGEEDASTANLRRIREDGASVTYINRANGESLSSNCYSRAVGVAYLATTEPTEFQHAQTMGGGDGPNDFSPTTDTSNFPGLTSEFRIDGNALYEAIYRNGSFVTERIFTRAMGLAWQDIRICG